ncbi:MAG TPA: ATP-binding protein [Flavitalea sp.]|nr:ATP-binding protein [Flavitalea sp.]
MEKIVDNNASRGNGRTEPDIYDYKQMVLEKEKFQKILENKVKELDRSNKELEEFAYIASHDLQEPLRKITSFSERLKEKLPSNLEPDVQLYLNRMLAATDNMRTLIDNLLEFSRTSRISEPFRRTDLNNVISEVRADLELKIEETSTTIKSDTLPVVDAIPLQMRQLFTNLFTNAIKFKGEDALPEIEIKSAELSDEEKEENHLNQNTKYYKINVKDHGIGFDQEFAMKIFQIFQRLHGKAEYPGSGIGLAICKKIVENHSGRIFAESEPGKGAEFIIILPEFQS